MTAETKLRKALYMLDKAKYTEAISILTTVISDARIEDDEVTKYSAMCCLGDVYVEIGERGKAVSFLQEVSEVKRDDDILDYEINRAKELLIQISEN